MNHATGPRESDEAAVTTIRKSRRGFAGMAPDKQRAIAASGGRAAHAMGLAHEYTSETGRKAGRVGGTVIGQNREHMAAIGRRGGMARVLKQMAATKI